MKRRQNINFVLIEVFRLKNFRMVFESEDELEAVKNEVNSDKRQENHQLKSFWKLFHL